MRSSSVCRVDPTAYSGWDEQVSILPGATFFHSAAWARVLGSTYGFTPAYFITESAGRFESVLPLMDIRSWLTGRRGVGLPFTDECPPLWNEAGAFEQNFSEAINYGTSKRWKCLELRGGKSLLPAAQRFSTYWGHRLELFTDEAVQLTKVSKSARGVIKKALQTNLSVEILTSIDALREFHQLLCLTRKRHGVPPQPFSFFRNIHRYILAEKRGCIILAKLGATPVAGALYLHMGTEAIYKFAASDEGYKHLGGNNLVMWKGIRWHAEQGFKTLCLGRSDIGNEGLRKFKLGWGPAEYPIEYVKWDFRTNSFIGAEVQRQGWQAKVFNRLPEPLARLLGTMLYRHVA